MTRRRAWPQNLTPQPGCDEEDVCRQPTYPFHAGTFSTDVANTVHWDGARTGEKEPAIILLTGVGPVKTVQVDESGSRCHLADVATNDLVDAAVVALYALHTEE